MFEAKESLVIVSSAWERSEKKYHSILEQWRTVGIRLTHLQLGEQLK